MKPGAYEKVRTTVQYKVQGLPSSVKLEDIDTVLRDDMIVYLGITDKGLTIGRHRTMAGYCDLEGLVALAELLQETHEKILEMIEDAAREQALRTQQKELDGSLSCTARINGGPGLNETIRDIIFGADFGKGSNHEEKN